MRLLCVLVYFGFFRRFGCEFGCPYRMQFKYLCLNMYVYLYLRSFLDISVSNYYVSNFSLLCVTQMHLMFVQ